MNSNTQTTQDRIVREPERKLITAVGRTTAWHLERRGLFPKRRQLFPHSNNVGWLLSELNEWVASREYANSGAAND
ncbi:AlpA family transcriptional regulator [Shewanella sp. C32]|uniref:AlpA family transcriptional regulator n=1 Tax=Shewanella electrica TaxID=515560 RepID=A0ABT2FNB2_9GAMM|nr:AlpA family phage regulatory protein [Shewanella electrica]MCH1926395.1 AlpA family transcriptional regulator [Shewanella electrica]MCS4557834.1 AlpA family transcriptional regulator [Shewanella electrica]